MKQIDIVVPCYNEEEVLVAFYETTNGIVSKIPDYDFHYIFVDDGSQDLTLHLLKGLSNQYANVDYISFAKNFGKEPAMYAGLSHSTGDYCIIMDADLQHPPALIPEMVLAVEEGYDCCAAYRLNRKGEAPIRSFFSRQFYKVNNALTSTKMPYGAVDFRIMSHAMVEAIISLQEVERFSKGIFSYVGFSVKWIGYENVERTMGQTKWKLRSLLAYAMDGITAFSVKPLHFVSIMGCLISFFAIIYALYIFVKAVILGVDLPGYTSTICLVLFLGGVIEFSLGIISEYLCRIFVEIKNRPIYIAKENTLTSKDKKKKKHGNDKKKKKKNEEFYQINEPEN
ncbi:MAG: glycosyltransferase family 2 protein [Lachnospiraceae bacterium]|nr:glycosyltransferase family 2 protein [Lachnospiraceae bacterium]